MNIELTDRQATVLIAYLQPALHDKVEEVRKTAQAITDQMYETYGVDHINRMMDEVGV